MADSAAFEDVFERRLRTAGLAAGPLACAALWIFNPGDHPPEARRLLGILALAVCFWMTEAIPLPATALLEKSAQQYRDFVAKAGDGAEFSAAVKRSKERSLKFEVVVKALRRRGKL